MKSLIESQFVYRLLVWMCLDKTSDNRINHLHESALRTFTMKIYQHLKKWNIIPLEIKNPGTIERSR